MTIPTWDEKEVIKDYYKMELREVRERHGMKASNTILNILKRHNKKLKGPCQRDRKKDPLIINAYKKMFNRKVCKKYNISTATLYSILNEYNVSRKGMHKIPFILRNYVNQQILYGSVLGDACIEKNIVFTETHSMKQKNYLLWKNNYLKLPFRYKKNNGFGKEYSACKIHSASNDPWLKELRTVFYPIGKKVVTIDILNAVDELGLLIWFLDDGSFCNKGYHYSGVLCTDGFSYFENQLIQNWFKNKWNIGVKIYSVKRKTHKQYRIYFPVQATKKLQLLLRPVFIKYKFPRCMQYKLWK